MQYITKILESKVLPFQELNDSMNLAIQEVTKLKDEALFLKLVKAYADLANWEKPKTKTK